MSNAEPIPILPYSLLVGQEQAKLALELAYITPRLGGVLISGQRGTGKSTIVRAFSHMLIGQLPVTLPINATDDRVIGGWNVSELMKSKSEWQPGLLEEANRRMLYVDEVNLLDDHLVNIILDVASTGILVVQREGQRAEQAVSFTLVGTMNPEEGLLRPQLLDRFGLMVNVQPETDNARRLAIVQTVLDFDHARFLLDAGQSAPILDEAHEQDKLRRSQLEAARQREQQVVVTPSIAEACVMLAQELQTAGHRGEYVTALAARAHAALHETLQVTANDVRIVAPLALQHRRVGGLHAHGNMLWTKDDDEIMTKVLSHV